MGGRHAAERGRRLRLYQARELRHLPANGVPVVPVRLLADARGNERTVWSGIHAAIWSLTSGENLGSGETLAIRDLLLTDAMHVAKAATFDTDAWYVLSPGTGPYSGLDGQEFLIRAQSTVPEPSSYLLMGTGLLLLAAFRRRRRLALSVDEA